MTDTISSTDLSPEKSFSITEREFREEIIYFLIVDRFFDASSDDEERHGIWDRGPNPGLYDKTWTQWGKYWGGNLLGIIEKIPYLQSLGVTCIWLSPLFEQVDDMQFDRAPMHGYWTKDFKRINPRFLTTDEPNSLHSSPTLRRLVDTLHDAGIKLVLDIVCNHSSPDINGSKGIVFDDGNLLCDYHHDHNHFYHHNPEISDWENEYQLLYYEMLGLATFNESNPVYRSYIKDAMRQWLDVGVDALRVDTLKHMPLWFWQEFCSDIKKHKPDTFLFGEYGFCKPWDSRSVSYANHSGMSILDFGLADAIRYAFSGKEPGGFHLVETLLSFDHVYHRANELVTFLDNHDMPRFLSICPYQRSLEQALILLFTLRGVPCIFYGTEQFLVDNTDGGNDPYNRPMMQSWDLSSSAFQLIQTLSRIRRANQSLTFGSHQQLYVSNDIYAYIRHYRDFYAICVLNKGPHTQITLDVGDRVLSSQLYCELTDTTHTLSNHQLALDLPPGQSHLFSVLGSRVTAPVVTTFQLNGVLTSPGQHLVLTGDCPELGEWDLNHAYGMEYVNLNTWICEVPFDASCAQSILFKYAIADATGSFIRENILPRTLLLPEQGRQKIDSIWQSS